MYICVCNAVTDSDVRTAVDDGVRNLKQLRKATGCANTCGRCEEMAITTLEDMLAEKMEIQSLFPIMQTA